MPATMAALLHRSNGGILVLILVSGRVSAGERICGWRNLDGVTNRWMFACAPGILGHAREQESTSGRAPAFLFPGHPADKAHGRDTRTLCWEELYLGSSSESERHACEMSGYPRVAPLGSFTVNEPVRFVPDCPRVSMARSDRCELRLVMREEAFRRGSRESRQVLCQCLVGMAKSRSTGQGNTSERVGRRNKPTAQVDRITTAWSAV